MPRPLENEGERPRLSHVPGDEATLSQGAVSTPAPTARLYPASPTTEVAGPPAHVYELLEQAQPSRRPQRCVQVRGLLHLSAVEWGSGAVRVNDGIFSAVERLKAAGVYSLDLWEVAVASRAWHEHRAGRGGGGDGSEEIADGTTVVEGGQVVRAWGACIGPGMELWTARQHHNAATYLGQVLSVMVGSTGGDGPTLPFFASRAILNEGVDLAHDGAISLYAKVRKRQYDERFRRCFIAIFVVVYRNALLCVALLIFVLFLVVLRRGIVLNLFTLSFDVLLHLCIFVYVFRRYFICC